MDMEQATKLGPLSQEIARRFQEEVTAVNALEAPWWGLHKNSKPVSPSPMQKYVAWRLKTDRVFGNWSGTGAGKTASAGLASYVIGSQLTVILAANSTVLGWKEQLEDTFPGCRVFTQINKVQCGEGAFLVMNYERFQNCNGRKMAAQVVALQPAFVVLDEIQMVKQRDGEASTRSKIIREMLTALPGIHVLGMSATPVINELREGISLLETIKQETSLLKTRATIPNALDLFAALRQIGVRYQPKYEQEEETVKINTQRDDLLPSLLDGTDILAIERTLLQAKLEAIKDRIKPGTIIYLEYVDGMAEPVCAFVRSLGCSVGKYIGETQTLERETVKNEFLAGEIDVLVGSRAIGIGVDGLQERCQQLILLSLPWTHAAYTQVVGRVYRQGGKGKVQIVIPQVKVGEWSWDEARMKHIESKRTLAECATDGVIPTTSTLSRNTLATKAIETLNKLSKKAKASSLRTHAVSVSPPPMAKVKAQAVNSAKTTTTKTQSQKVVRLNRSEGIRLFKLAGRPTKGQFIAVYGPNGPRMTWQQRAEAGVPAERFQAALAEKAVSRPAAARPARTTRQTTTLPVARKSG